MGATVLHRSVTDKKAYLDAQFEWPSAVEKSVMVGSTYYAAVRNRDGKVFGYVCKTESTKGTFSYNFFSEFEHPYSYDCPKSILNLLDQTDVQSGLNWRSMCRQVTAQKAAAKKLKDGDTIKFKDAIDFGKWGKLDTFTLAQDGKKVILTNSVVPNARFTISHWKTREFTIVSLV